MGLIRNHRTRIGGTVSKRVEYVGEGRHGREGQAKS